MSSAGPATTSPIGGTRSTALACEPSSARVRPTKRKKLQSIEPRKHQAINTAERQSLPGFAPQHVELVSKDKDLGFQRRPRPGTGRLRRTRSTCKDHSSGASISRFAVAVSRFGFAVGTGTLPSSASL
jgi:hypothetical protein